jgi:hypothetical protein
MATAPAWLTQRGGDVKLGSDGKTWFVFLNHQPTYSVAVVPVGGKFSYALRQTINGNRNDSQKTCASSEEAVMAALEDLRKILGWA